MEKKKNALARIRREIFALKESPLYAERIANGALPVIGEGDEDASVMFVGEAPGRKEAETGRPFVGASGKFLDELLSSIALDRSSVYITNVVKDRPTDNRDPLPGEIALYAPFLDRQIDIIQPRVIVTLGRISMRYVMETFGLSTQIRPISIIHGKVFEADASHGPLKIIPMYHPAAALYDGSLRQTMKNDFQGLKKVL